MPDEKDSNDPKSTESQDAGAGEELREGLMHFFSAARKVLKSAEPHVTRSLDDAERVIGKLGRGGEVVANEVGKEVANLATRLAERLRAAANRPDGEPTDEPKAATENDHSEPEKK